MKPSVLSRLFNTQKSDYQITEASSYSPQTPSSSCFAIYKGHCKPSCP